MKKFIIFLIIIAVIGSGFYYFHRKTVKAPELSAVIVQKGTIVEKAQAIGYIQPRHSNTVKSPVNGTVAEIYHEEGEFVKKGEPLVKIKPEPEPEGYAAAYAEVEVTRAQESSALKDLRRFDHALKTKLITRNFTDYINARNNYDTAKANRILAEQKLALLNKGTTKVANRTIDNIVKSPISGYILARNVDVGDPVISLSSAQASTPLFTMANMGDLMFQGSVDEMDAAKLKLGMAAIVTVGAEPKQTITGGVSKIALQSDQQKLDGAQADSDLPFNVSFEVEITKLKLPEHLILRSGYSATADVAIKTAKNVLILPERVLHFRDNKVYVLLPPAKPDEKPKEQTVKIGLSDGMNAEIISGVKLGDKILDKPDIPEED